MTTTVQKQVLINARILIADPAHWTYGMFACTSDGRKAAWYDQSATRWCASGALYRAAYDLVGDPKKATSLGNEVGKSIYPRHWFRGGLSVLNDVRGHAAVLAAFDEALQIG